MSSITNSLSERILAPFIYTMLVLRTLGRGLFLSTLFKVSCKDCRGYTQINTNTVKVLISNQTMRGTRYYLSFALWHWNTIYFFALVSCNAMREIISSCAQSISLSHNKQFLEIKHISFIGTGNVSLLWSGFPSVLLCRGIVTDNRVSVLPTSSELIFAFALPHVLATVSRAQPAGAAHHEICFAQVVLTQTRVSNKELHVIRVWLTACGMLPRIIFKRFVNGSMIFRYSWNDWADASEDLKKHTMVVNDTHVHVLHDILIILL